MFLLYSGLLGVSLRLLAFWLLSKISLLTLTCRRDAYFTIFRSPIFLINAGRTDEAKKVMTKLYSSRFSIDDRLAYLVKTISEEQEQQTVSAGSYFDCFKGTNLKRTLTVMFLYSTANLGGAAFLSQSIYFLLTLGLPAVHVFDISIGGFALAIVIIVLTGVVGKLLSRRTMLLAGCLINLVFLLVIGCLHYAPGMRPAWAVAVLMCVLPPLPIPITSTNPRAGTSSSHSKPA